MKKVKMLRFNLFLFGIMVLLGSCTSINKDGLPSIAKAFLNKHFDETEIISIEQDENLDYEVRLEDGVQINFERKGNWEEINVKKNQFPETILETLPQQLDYYVKTNYPGQTIRKIERKGYGYRVSLNKPNNVELTFTKQGAFIKEEDK